MQRFSAPGQYAIIDYQVPGRVTAIAIKRPPSAVVMIGSLQ
jgi:hypothetical protein